MGDGAAADVDVGVAVDGAGAEAELAVVAVHTAAAAVDVTAEDDGCIGARLVGAGFAGLQLGAVAQHGVGHSKGTTHGATGHGDIGVVEHVAVLARAEDGAADVGAILDVDIGVLGEGEVGEFAAGHTTGGAEDVAVVTARGAYLAATDGDGGDAAAKDGGVGGDGHFVIVAHRSHRAAAIDIVVDGAAADVDIGVAVDAAGAGAEVAVVAVHTAAAAVDVAVEVGHRALAELRDVVVIVGVGGVVGGVFHPAAAAAAGVGISVAGAIGAAGVGHLLRPVGAVDGRADGAAADVHLGVGHHVAVGAAAEDRATHIGAGLDIHFGVVDEGLVGIVGAAISHTAARAVDEAVVAAGRANHAAVDGDGGLAGSGFSVVARDDGVVDVGAHRGDGAAAEDVVAHGAAADVDNGVAEHLAGSLAQVAALGHVDTAATAVDVAVVDIHTGFAIRVKFFFPCSEFQAHGAAIHGDGGVVAHVTVLAAAEHRGGNLTAMDDDLRLVDIGHAGVVEAEVCMGCLVVVARTALTAAEDGARAAGRVACHTVGADGDIGHLAHNTTADGHLGVADIGVVAVGGVGLAVHLVVVGRSGTVVGMLEFIGV